MGRVWHTWRVRRVAGPPLLYQSNVTLSWFAFFRANRPTFFVFVGCILFLGEEKSMRSRLYVVDGDQGCQEICVERGNKLEWTTGTLGRC